MSERPGEIDHQYPENVHILKNGYISTLLTRLSQSSCQQPQFNQILKKIYCSLAAEVFHREWPQEDVTCPTRMSDTHPDNPLKASIFKQLQPGVVVDIARAGMLPSQVLFDELCHLVAPQVLRVDHVFASRVTDANDNVTHTELSSSKIGGDVEGALVFFPDPMGATGNSLCEVIEYYKTKVSGTPKKWIALQLIVTPEFVKKVTTTHPDVEIYGARLDRGLSPAHVLQTTPGTHWELEYGLSDIQYIVPGAGGVGEIINNSFV